MIKRKQIEGALEKRIAIGAVVSKAFLEAVVPIYDRNYIQNAFVARVLQWCISYFNEYEDAPFRHIEDIFNAEKENITQAETDILTQFLSDLSEEYTQSFNEKYTIDQALDYFKKRELELTTSIAAQLVESGKTAEAEELILGFKQISRTLSKWEDPFTDEALASVFSLEEETGLFQWPGALNYLIGSLKRGWFGAVFAPRKRGKSFTLIEMAVQGLFQNLKVVFFSLEMKSEDVKRRIYKRLTALGNEDREYVYPCFDCYLNQVGKCERPERRNHVILRPENAPKPAFERGMEYRPCAYCRNNRIDAYRVATWFEIMRQGDMNRFDTSRKMKAFRQMYGRNLRLVCYPKFSANSKDLKRDLKILETLEGFVPDLILVDYADILAPEDARIVGRERINETWMCLGQMGSERNCIVFTASQMNRASQTKRYVGQIDASESIAKLDHIDVGIALNQLEDEKREGVMRISTIAHRHKDFFEHDYVLALQQMSLGQFYLDGHFVRQEFDAEE